MDLLNRLTAKQLIMIILIVGFLIYNLDSKNFVVDFFSSMRDRFDIKNKLNEIGDELDASIVKSEDNTGDTNIKEINELRETHLKSEKLGDEDDFCNKKRERGFTQFEEMFQCLINNEPMTKDILRPTNTIPYNFDNNKNNNVLYSINPTHTESKLSYEKSLSGGVAAVNNKILHSNFDKDIDYYKISRKRDTILNLEEDSVVCNINDLQKFPKKINLFTRRIDNKVLINWNIPILPFGYLPKEIVFVLSRRGDLTKKKNSRTAEIWTIPFSKKPCEYESDNFIIRTNILGNRIFFNFSSEINNWYNEKDDCYKLSTRVFFLFDYYDKHKSLKQCVMESNVSNLF